MKLSLALHREHHTLASLILGLTGATTLLSGAIFFLGPPLLPLWYSLVEPADQLAPRFWVVTAPATAWAMAFVFWVLGRKTELDHERYLALLALWSGVILQALLFFALIRTSITIL